MNSLIREVTWIERLNKEDGKKVFAKCSRNGIKNNA